MQEQTGVKDKWGRGENLFSSICLSMTYVTVRRQAVSIPHGLFCFLMALKGKGSRKGLEDVCVSNRSDIRKTFIITRSLCFHEVSFFQCSQAPINDSKTF